MSSSWVNLDINSWQDLLGVLIQGIVLIATIGLGPWFTFRTVKEKGKIDDARQRLNLKNKDLAKLKEFCRVAEQEIKFYKNKTIYFEECLFNIQARVESALEFTEIFYTPSEKLDSELIKQTPPLVLNHLSLLRDQTHRQQRHLDSFYRIFQEILVFTNKTTENER